jgi:MipA family protein
MKPQFANRVTLAVTTSLLCFATQAQTSPEKSDWIIRAGAGVVSAPASIGASKRRNMLLPNIDVRNQNGFFASVADGIGFETKPGDWTLSAALGADFYSRDPKDNSRLAGLEKIGFAPALKLGAGYALGDFNLSAALSSRLGSANKRGNSLVLEGGYNAIASKKLLGTVGLTGTVIDTKFARNLVSISPADSLVTGLPVYQAGSGLLDAGVFAQALYRIDDRWIVFSRLQLMQLQGDAAKSPLVQKKNQTTFLLFATYSF